MENKKTSLKMDKEQKSMKWKTLDSEYLIRRPWLTARRDKVQLPNGHVIDEYYVLEYPTWINVIAITPDDQFVFVRQYRYALGKTVDEIVAGVVEDGEDPMVAAKRELEEETGYTGGEWRELMVSSANASTMTNLTHSYIAYGVVPEGTPHLDDGEDIDVKLFSRSEVRSMLERGEIWQSLMAAPLWKMFAEDGLSTSV